MKQVTISLKEKLYEMLEKKAKEKNKEVAEIIGELLEYIESIEYYGSFFKQIEKAAEKEYNETVKFRDTRILGEEGVPVFLLLDDLSDGKTDDGKGHKEESPSAFDLFLSLISTYYLRARVEGKDEIKSSDIGEVVGALADKYFAILPFEEWRKG